MAKQLLHLVFGGELDSLDKLEFRDLSNVHFVGLYPNYAKALAAWKGAAQKTVDNAHMRYFVVHLHRLLQPDETLAFAKAKVTAQSPAKKTGTKSTAKAGKTRSAK
jgi:hypothetical protein